MEMAYRERWQTEIAALKKILSGFDFREERKWGKPMPAIFAGRGFLERR